MDIQARLLTLSQSKTGKTITCMLKSNQDGVIREEDGRRKTGLCIAASQKLIIWENLIIDVSEERAFVHCRTRTADRKSDTDKYYLTVNKGQYTRLCMTILLHGKYQSFQLYTQPSSGRLPVLILSAQCRGVNMSDIITCSKCNGSGKIHLQNPA